MNKLNINKDIKIVFSESICFGSDFFVAFCTDSLSYSYNGNQLATLSGSAVGTYSYDANGNMTHDGANGIDLEYNSLNLIKKATRDDEILANYSYLADGTKLSATNAAGEGLVYAGSLAYKKQGNSLNLESAAFSGGRFVASQTSDGTIFTPQYHLTDHLGSTRVVMNAAGDVLERNDYYPFGLRWADSGSLISDNRYRYNGKEEQDFVNVPFVDYGARMYDAKYRIVWNSIDPLAETYYPITPYAFCANNPVKYIDTDGRKIRPTTNRLAVIELKDALKKTKTGRMQLNKLETNKSDVRIHIVNGYHKNGKHIYGESILREPINDPSTGEINGGVFDIVLYRDAIKDDANRLGIDYIDRLAATAAEEIQHTEAENVKLQVEEDKETKKIRETNPDYEPKYEDLQSEQQAHVYRGIVMDESIKKR